MYHFGRWDYSVSYERAAPVLERLSLSSSAIFRKMGNVGKKCHIFSRNRIVHVESRFLFGSLTVSLLTPKIIMKRLLTSHAFLSLLLLCCTQISCNASAEGETSRTADKIDKINWNTPIDVLEAEAEKDNPDALCWLAGHYGRGSKGLSKNAEKASELYQRGAKFADQGSPAAQTCRGVCYEKGYGVDKDLVEAVKWYRKAAEQEFPVAQYNLGRCYTNGNGVPQDHAEAVKWYRKAAEQEYPIAQNSLGVCYANGTGVDKDILNRVFWYSKAAEQGYAMAQYNLGAFIINREQGGENRKEAVRLFLKAADQGFAAATEAVRNYPRIVEIIAKERVAVEELRKAAAQGDAEAQYQLGLDYYKGYSGVPLDFTESAKWFRKAAEQGHAEAQGYLGDCYNYGKGVSVNEKEAVKWYHKAAVQGLSMAQYELGICYAEGRGVRKNVNLAAEWYRQAAAQGNSEARWNLQKLLGETPEKAHALCNAVLDGNIEVVKSLVSEGTGVNGRDVESRTPLCTAVSTGNIEIVKFLITKGANVNVKDVDGNTPLHRASRVLSSDYLTGSNFDSAKYSDEYKALFEVIKFLVAKGANVNTPNENGDTPLHQGARGGDIEIVKFLVAKEANVNTPNELGYTPLHCTENIEIIKFLVSKGADVNAKTYDYPRRSILPWESLNECAVEGGNTPLHLAARGREPEVLKCLLDLGANPNITRVDTCYAQVTTYESHHDFVLKAGTLPFSRRDQFLLGKTVYSDPSIKKNVLPIGIAKSPEKKALLEEAMKKWEQK